jgi:hypothetical protein
MPRGPMPTCCSRPKSSIQFMQLSKVLEPGSPPHHTFTPLKGGVEGVDVWMALIVPHIHTLPHHTRKDVELLVNVFYRRNACHSR